MSDKFTPGASSAAGLNAAFAAKLDAANAAMAGSAASIPTGPLANRPVNPGDFTFYGVTDLKQLQIFVGGTWIPLTGVSGSIAPGPVGNLQGSASANSVNLSWNSPTTGTSPFVFTVNYRVTGTSAWNQFTNTSANSILVTGLISGTQYDFQVITTGQVAPPSTSATAQITTQTVSPNAPTAVTAGTITDTTIALTWTAPSAGGPVSYVVNATAGSNTITSPPLSGTSYTLTGLAANTEYAITVTATNNGGSASSAPINATTSAAAGTAPNAPTNLAASNVLASNFTLGWTASTQGTGISYQPEWAAVSGTAVSGIVREPYLQPGNAQSVWNLPVGSGATWSNTADVDQADLTSLSCTISFGSQFGVPVWTGQSSDPVITVSSPAAPPVTTTRTWYNSPGGDGTFWVSPFETTANFITSGSLITTLQNGSNSSPTGHLHIPPDYAAPWYVGQATDPLVAVTVGSKTINVHLPVGAQIEQPWDLASDSSIGGADATQPYLVWSVSGAKMYNSAGTEIDSISGPGCKIVGSYGLQVDDGSGQMMMDIVTGQPGTNNSFGGITEYDMQQALADSSYVAQHMLAYSLDPSQCSGQGPIWPLKVIDSSFPNTGGIPQGCTVGIPPGTAYPSGKTGNRAFKFLWDILQQYGAFFYNVGSTGCFQLWAYPQSSPTTTFANQISTEMDSIAGYLAILNYNQGVSGAQYSIDTQKGKLPSAASKPAFSPPPPLDLSPSAGKAATPSSFGAWYPSGFNAVWPNTGVTASTQYQRDPGLTANIHVPADATISPTDQAEINLFDLTQPNKIWSGIQCVFNNGTNPSGGITCQRLETDLTCQSMTDATTGNYGYDSAIGLIRNFDLAQGKIQHALRWQADPSIMSAAGGSWAAGVAWPDTHADLNLPGYTGKVQPGATIGIPASVNLDSLGLTTGGRMLADALQQFGAIWRGTVTGGVTFSAELNIDAQYVPLLQQMQQDCPKLLPYLRIMRNQSSTSKNGGGTRLFIAPPPLDTSICTGATGGGSGGAPSSFQPIGQPTTGTSTGIVGLQPNTRYAFEVIAENSQGQATSEILYMTTAVSGSAGGGPATPTTTWDAAKSGGGITLSSDKLTAFTNGSTTPGSVPQTILSTSGKTTGMFWFAVTAQIISQDFAIGIANGQFNYTTPGGLGSDANGIGYYSVSPTQAIYYNGNGLTYGGTDTDANGDALMVVVDIDGEQLWVTSKAMQGAVGAKAWNNSLTANPATKSGGISFSGMSGTKYIAFNNLEGGSAAVLNTGASAAPFPVPAGVQPWDPGTGGGSGGGGTSTGSPTMTGPATETVVTNGAVSVSGISLADSGATSTCTIAMACSKGTLTSTVGGTPVTGSGTASISYSNTLVNCQQVAANLVYTAGTATGSDNIGVTFTDNFGQTATIHIPVTITASGNPALLPAGPLSALGAQIVDQNNNPVRISSVGWNWYGGLTGIPQGLDTLSYKTMLSALVSGGINTVRIGVAMASVNRDDPFPSTGTGKFFISNGQIIGPSGAQFIAGGLNVDTDTNADQVANLFPGINFVRFPCGSYVTPDSIASFVEGFTAKNIVVEIEYHPWPLINAQSGSALQAEANWYASLANYFKGNPYVWFGSMNEPQGGDISAEQVAVYNAIRGAGNDTIIMMSCGVGSGNPGSVGPAVLTVSSYASMTGIVWDQHFYGWSSNFSTDQTTVENTYLGSATSGSGLLAAQAIKSADGVVPVLNGEFGPSTSATGIDANASQVEFTVGTWAITNSYSAGFAGWGWDQDPYNAVQNNGVLTSWGNSLAGFIAAVPKGNPASGSTGINYTLNPDLQGKAYNEALQTVITYGRSVGLRFIIDWHNCEGNNTVNGGASNPNGLWYDVGGASNGTDGGGNTGTITQQTYVNLNTKVATMFAGSDAVIGIDMINAPTFNATPGCSWGAYTPSSGVTGQVGSATDLRAAYEAAGNAALAANPNLLIICQTPQDTANPTNAKYAPEGATQAAQSYPVALNVAKKLVYAGHIYPKEVSGANPDNGASFITRLNTEFGWLYDNNQGPPFFVSECGDNMRTTDGTTYVTGLIAYLNGQDGSSSGPTFSGSQQGISWSWWDLGVVQTPSTPPGFGILSANAGGVDSVQRQYWDQMLYVVPGSSTSGGVPLIKAPLTGTVTTGTWQYGDLQFASMPHGSMHYAYLLPHNYSAANSYPILVYMHQNTEGNAWYQQGGDPTQNTIVFQDVIDGTFNTVAFRTDHPCIVIVPFCDQTDGTGGTGLNFGGYNDVPGQNVNENAVAGIAQYFWANFSCYQPRTYVTGQSLGGIGTIAQMLDYNRVNGPIGKVWTAGFCLSGEIVRTPDPVNTPSIMNRMATVPLFCVAGSGDDTPSSGADNNNYERPAWTYFTGNTNYPAPPGVMGGSVAGCQAGTSQYFYAEDTTLGHNTWSGNPSGHNYGLYPSDGSPFYDWLFSQEVA